MQFLREIRALANRSPFAAASRIQQEQQRLVTLLSGPDMTAEQRIQALKELAALSAESTRILAAIRS